MAPSGSVKHLECWYWRNTGNCEHEEAVCLYSHRPTGQVAGKPVKREPGSKSQSSRTSINPLNHEADYILQSLQWPEETPTLQDPYIETGEQARVASSMSNYSGNSTVYVKRLELLDLSTVLIVSYHYRSTIYRISTSFSQPAHSDNLLILPLLSALYILFSMQKVLSTIAPTESSRILSNVQEPSSSSAFFPGPPIPSTIPLANSGALTTTARPPQLSSPSGIPNRSDLTSLAALPNPSASSSVPALSIDPVLPPRIPEPWAAQVEKIHAQVSCSSNEFLNGLSIFNISEEGTGPGSRFMTGELHKHFNVLVDVLERDVHYIGTACGRRAAEGTATLTSNDKIFTECCRTGFIEEGQHLRPKVQ